jgi:two-component system sensor histidine kinase TctE
MNPPALPWLQRLASRAIGGGSLHRQLLLWLLLPQLVLWLAAAFVTYNVASRYAERGIDASLAQATRSLARQVKPIGNGLFIDFPRAAQDIIEADPDDRVYYMVSTPPGKFILGSKQLPLPQLRGAPLLNETYFYDAMLDKLPVRLAALYLPIGAGTGAGTGPGSGPELMLVQVARSRASRDELARSILLDTGLPLSALIALMTMIVWAGIRAGLAPLTRLRAQVEHRAPNDLAPLQLQDAPREVRGLAQALNALLVAVQESVSAQRRFISNAAHQLRTPLAGLKSQTEVALKSAQEPALNARLQRVHESAVRASHLVNQLMALTRAEPEAAGSLPRAPVDLRRLALDLTAENVPRALQAGVDLGVDETGATRDDGAPVMVMGAEALLREAVFNLLDNAIRYAGRGAEVTVALRVEPGRATLQVADNGPGLPDDQLEAVFGRFYRASTEGTGCGLGLAIVREIAERHGGSVRAQHVPPHGLLVSLVLPLAG